jgi:hypothetical protein
MQPRVVDLAKAMKKLGFCDSLPSHKILVELESNAPHELQQLGVRVDGCLDERKGVKVSFSRFGKEESGGRLSSKSFPLMRQGQVMLATMKVCHFWGRKVC